MTIIGQLRDAIRSRQERIRYRPFMEATMAACALVAIADGEVSFSERVRLDQMLESLEELQAFDPHEAVDRFNDYVQQLTDDPATAQAEALEAVRHLADDEEEAALVLKLCIALCRADGRFTETERVAAKRVAETLGLPAPDYLSV
ncbi:tellurite resistance protein TerB [Tistlia consotensis]|uniref:Tellurite resistance protein TerB/tellurium resistance protein TerD n=1 Tax=Tistlia consotensis USBA 355 TaxID=560819 RepID=A0A1Y6CN42_9PROT|nr:TerB family tellurite resistance protein [Tistlia consotensis]SMF79105.1 tellurite resistance protein TerB/tellurium resistance protein TerD [Tistlia consotensis USBA 355]SNS15848.1 tellurite resistance protein TerB [Tistlia consotensis]